MGATTIEGNTKASTARSAPVMSAVDRPLLSVVIPCRNEAAFIGACLESLVCNGYPTDRMEILVVDGMSGDGTREIVRSCARNYRFVHLLDNPHEITPCALNIGVNEARGDVIMRVDAHATYEPGYIEYCVAALGRYAVDGTGGIWKVVARTDGILSRAVVAAMTHSFGGAARYRRAAGNEQRLVDLVPFFCCRRETLMRAGQFNERLVRHQDFEYTVRLRRMGAQFMLVPRAVCNYYARSDLKSFCAHSFRDGLWIILATAYTDVLPLSLRHVTPLVFVTALVVGSIAAPFSTLAAQVLAVIGTVYVAGALGAGAQIAVRERSAGLLVVTPPVFAARHITFGIGSLFGLLRVAVSRELWHGLISSQRAAAASARTARAPDSNS